MDDGNRATVQIAVDTAIVETIEAMGLDVARVAEELLRRYARDARNASMMDADRRTLRQQIRAEVAWSNRSVDEHGHFGQSWRTF
jgi:post-segregation antitoxin (ccd killing protein)